ncbi:MAG: cyclic nucleotide-binding domain-containing protein [Elusimicrobiota bacterium]
MSGTEETRFLTLMLRSLPLFAGLNPEQAEKLLPIMKLYNLDAGTVVIEEGGTGDAFFAIYSGKVKVEVKVPGFFGGKRLLNTLGPGKFFGELALILHQPRTATVTCVEPTQCFVLEKEDFTELLEQNPDIAELVKTTGQERYDELG